MNTSVATQDKFCPFLGINDDPQSLMAYTSPQNCCYHCKPAVRVRLDHQNGYCLDSTHVNCPAYNQEIGLPLPKGLRYKTSSQTPRQGRTRFIVVGVILIGMILLGAWIVSANSPHGLTPTATPNSVSIQPTDTPTVQAPSTDTLQSIPSNTVVASQATILPTLTLMVSPFPSLTPTSLSATPTKTPKVTATPTALPTLVFSPTATEVSPHSLEVPIGRGQLYLIHRIVDGENLPGIAKKYETSVEAITAVNYVLTVPIWANSLIVIPLGVTGSAGLPIFEPYQVTEDQITVETLAAQLSFDAQLFKDFNDLADGEKLRLGDWFLVPRNSYK